MIGTILILWLMVLAVFTNADMPVVTYITTLLIIVLGAWLRMETTIAKLKAKVTTLETQNETSLNFQDYTKERLQMRVTPEQCNYKHTETQKNIDRVHDDLAKLIDQRLNDLKELINAKK